MIICFQNKINLNLKKKFFFSFHTCHGPPWYDRNIGKLSKDKKKAWKTYKKNPSPEHWTNYTLYRNKLSHEIEAVKEKYENSIAERVKDNPKHFWKYVNSKTKSRGKIVDLMNNEGHLVSDDRGKAQLLNNFFASVFTQENTDEIPDVEDIKPNLQILDNIEITELTLTKHLKSLNTSKAAGPDGINARIMKELAEEIAPILKILFDSSMNEGNIPSQWKNAHVTALFKKGSKRSPNNYRPVSLTSICCKLFEKIIRNAIIASIDEQGLFSDDQHGFREGRSCCTQLLEIMEIWTGWWDLGLPWDVIYTDFSKAFDSVPHKRLLAKIHAFGIRGNVLKWIEGFLSQRKQRVVIGSEFSDWQPVTSGIPQGSVLGPILFTIFINDMPDVVSSFKKLFADDTKIFRAIESLNDISGIQEDINKLFEWSVKWQLPFNIGKCKVIHYGKDNPVHEYTMNSVPLSADTSEKDLGVTFDTSLNFKTHIGNMIAKANSRVGLVKRAFSKLNPHSFKILYKSLIRPILEYCSVVWHPLYKGDEQEIEKVQRRATKLVPQLMELSYPERLRELNLTTLYYRRKRTDMIQVYRIVHNIDKIDYDLFFIKNDNGTRGHDEKLDKPRANTKIRQNSFSHRIINDWNALSDNTVNSPSINSFKNALEKEWINDPTKFDFEWQIPSPFQVSVCICLSINIFI